MAKGKKTLPGQSNGENRLNRDRIAKEHKSKLKKLQDLLQVEKYLGGHKEAANA